MTVPLFVCRTEDVDECQVEAISNDEGYTARMAVMAIWSQVQLAQWLVLHFKSGDASVPQPRLSLDTLRMFLMYAAENPGRGRRKRPVDVDALIDKWVPIIRGLATAHDKATVDQCEFRSEEHLLPLTAAPIVQLREFYAKLCDRLEADPTIPFFVWRAFRTWGDVVLAKLPDGGVKRLRRDLAQRLADLVERDITPDLNEALVAALQWRDAETLEQMATAVEQGAKPRMRGKESCLFLEVGEHTVML